MTIPEIRSELIEHGRILISLGQFTLGQRLLWLANEMWRRRTKHKAPPRPEPRVYRSNIVAYRRVHPDATQLDMAIHFGVNQRAISIALNGKRK